MMLGLTKVSFLFALFLSLLFHSILLFIPFPKNYLGLHESKTISSSSKAEKITTSTIALSQLPIRKDLSKVQIEEHTEEELSISDSTENAQEYSNTEEERNVEGEANENNIMETKKIQEDWEIRENQQFEEENLSDENNLESSENTQEIQEDLENEERKDRDENLETSQEVEENWEFEAIGTTDEEAGYSYNSWTDELRNFGVTIVANPIPKPNILMPFPSSACHLEGASSWASVFAIYPDLENKVPQEDQVILIQSSGYKPFNQLAFEEVSQKELSDVREGHTYILAVTFQYDANTCKSV